MEGFDLSLGKGRKPLFDEAPARFRRRIPGVDYLHLKGRQSGDLFITRAGWSAASSILPERWFTGSQFSKPGQPPFPRPPVYATSVAEAMEVRKATTGRPGRRIGSFRGLPQKANY